MVQKGFTEVDPFQPKMPCGGGLPLAPTAGAGGAPAFFRYPLKRGTPPQRPLKGSTLWAKAAGGDMPAALPAKSPFEGCRFRWRSSGILRTGFLCLGGGAPPRTPLRNYLWALRPRQLCANLHPAPPLRCSNVASQDDSPKSPKQADFSGFAPWVVQPCHRFAAGE